MNPDAAPPNKFRTYLTKKNIIIALSILIALAMIVGGVIWKKRSNSSDNNDPYILNATMTDLAPNHVFKFKGQYNIVGKDDVFELYSDMQLKQRIFLSSESNPYEDKVTVGPPKLTNRGELFKDYSETKPEWPLNANLYLVQRYDLMSGKKLKKPIVTPFTIKRPLTTPNVSYTVAADGSLQLSWQPVEGATSYIVTSSTAVEYNGRTNLRMRPITQTTATSWNSGTEDATYIQNKEFRAPGPSDDRLHNKGEPVSEEAKRQLAFRETGDYGVVATNGTDVSGYTPLNGAELRAQLPVEIARNALEEQRRTVNKVATIDKLPESIPVTMADGRTANKAVIFDLNNVKQEKRRFNTTEGGKLGTVELDILLIPATIAGTKLRLGENQYIVEKYNPSTFKSELVQIAKRNVDAQAPTGALASNYRYKDKPNIIDYSTIKAGKAPTVPYKIHASNPLTAYLAAHMIKGIEYINVREYQNKPGIPELSDALEEAINQNPYIVDFDTFYDFGALSPEGSGIIRIRYTIEDGAERSKLQEAIAAEVKRVTPQIISGKSSDRDKAMAINAYLAKTATYNYDALAALRQFDTIGYSEFRNAWRPNGVLLDKKGVCASYAQAFALLAREAGLDALYVTGTASGSGHAWNKVKLDGKWTVVDPTWNDSESSNGLSAYFGLSDSEAGKTRQQSAVFMSDLYIDRYVAK